MSSDSPNKYEEIEPSEKKLGAGSLLRANWASAALPASAYALCHYAVNGEDGKVLGCLVMAGFALTSRGLRSSFARFALVAGLTVGGVILANDELTPVMAEKEAQKIRDARRHNVQLNQDSMIRAGDILCKDSAIPKRFFESASAPFTVILSNGQAVGMTCDAK